MTGRRLASHTYDVRLKVKDGHHDLKITVAYNELGHVHEVVFVGRGKIGQGLDQILMDLGIATSRAVQGRDPMTGRHVAT